MRPILPDSSWYITEARRKQDPLLQLAEISITRDVATCGIVISEVGRGMKHPNTLQRYIDCWEVMSYVDSSHRIWQDTLQIAWQLDRQGRVLPIQDIHIAACALSINAVLLTHDQHFQEIPGLDATDRIL
jgi:predicted nucleic acid-binding protein